MEATLESSLTKKNEPTLPKLLSSVITLLKGPGVRQEQRLEEVMQ